MALVQMDSIGIVVEDLNAAIAFFEQLGMTLEGETTVEGPWVDQTIGLKSVRSDIARMRTPDGHGKIELSQFHKPKARRNGKRNAPVNTLGMGRIMFEVTDIKKTLARLRKHGGKLVGAVAEYENIYRLCYVRGPEGVFVGLAEKL